MAAAYMCAVKADRLRCLKLGGCYSRAPLAPAPIKFTNATLIEIVIGFKLVERVRSRSDESLLAILKAIHRREETAKANKIDDYRTEVPSTTHFPLQFIQIRRDNARSTDGTERAWISAIVDGSSRGGHETITVSKSFRGNGQRENDKRDRDDGREVIDREFEAKGDEESLRARAFILRLSAIATNSKEILLIEISANFSAWPCVDMSDQKRIMGGLMRTSGIEKSNVQRAHAVRQSVTTANRAEVEAKGLGDLVIVRGKTWMNMGLAVVGEEKRVFKFVDGPIEAIVVDRRHISYDLFAIGRDERDISPAIMIWEVLLNCMAFRWERDSPYQNFRLQDQDNLSLDNMSGPSIPSWVLVIDDGCKVPSI
ncbi:hypothetical protein SCHPADRAFT_888260 [Schizopora paradoxa]|uniref:Uncharacterized protein n=1 Tax=Schizopora paradoxa TaxID=27342 RepID=A0A0H2RVH1_9AGAM|nr:hypothetical protein SCHPADRAFT_888260 [Schizopora paradoxa]